MTTNRDAAAKTVAEAQAALLSAETEAAAAEAAYRDSLTTTDLKELEQLAQRKLTASVALDRANAILEAAEIRHAAAIAADAAAERQARYEAAQKLSEAAAKKLRKEYPRLATGIRDLLRELAEAERAVQAANADLPNGTTPLAGPEASRSTPNQYRETVSEEVVELWATIDSTQPIADDLQSRVQPHHGRRRRGMLTDREDSDDRPLTYGTLRTDGGSIDVVRKSFLRRRFLPDVSGRFVSPLADTITLPALDAGATPFWTPTSGGPEYVIRELDKPLQPRPADAKREPAVDYERVYQPRVEAA